MQAKIFGGAFAAFWSGVCYYAGKVSEIQSKGNYTSEKVEINLPESKSLAIETTTPQSTVTNTETFFDGMIQPPFRNISYPHFKILYSTYHKCPLAVHQKVTKSLTDGDAPRASSFFVQPSIQSRFRCTNDHFLKSKAYHLFDFNRGHMAAAGNYSGNKDAKFQTFTFANVVPQNSYNNGGIWNTFQRYSRNLLMRNLCQSVQIISGPIYYKNKPYIESPIYPVDPTKLSQGKYEKVFKQQSIVLLQNGVVAPQKLYKIIKCNTKTGQTYVDGFEFWNKKTFQNQKPLSSFTTSIQKIQQQTGLKFNFSKNSFPGKPILLKSLIEFDKDSFQKTKKVYDYDFYMNLMKNSKTIDELNNSFFRAKQQLIYIPLNQFDSQAKQLFVNDMKNLIETYRKNPQQTACKTLSNLMKQNKSLFYLRQLKQEYSQKIRQTQNSGPIELCLSKAQSLRSKNWDDLNQKTDPSTIYEKTQKSSLNSITHNISKSVSEQKAKSPFSYINVQKLKEFIITAPVIAEQPTLQRIPSNISTTSQSSTVTLD